MIFKTTVVGELAVNCFIMACEETQKGIVIDPGDNIDGILSIVKENNIVIRPTLLFQIYLTAPLLR